MTVGHLGGETATSPSTAPFPLRPGREAPYGRRIWDPVESLLTLANSQPAPIPDSSVGPPGLNDLVLGRYRLLECLGAGGFGVVWRAQDELLHRDVAVKRIPLAPDGDSERASREALASARLAHPAIVALYEACAVQDAFYLISELVHGTTLAQLIASRALTDEDVLEVGIALACALSHAHARGVIHRDIKPQNVLVPDQREERVRMPEGFVCAAKLTDFGGATLAGEDVLTHTGDVLGTLAYMAPEQSEGQEAGEETDLYALALVLYEALCGVNPVRGTTPAATARRIGRRLEPLERRRRDLPRGLTRALDAALAPSRNERGTVQELRLALEEGLERAPKGSRRKRRQHRREAERSSTAESPAVHPAVRVHPPDPIRAADLRPGRRDRAPALRAVGANPSSAPRGPAQASGQRVPTEPSEQRGRRRGLPRAAWLACAFAAVVWELSAGRGGVAVLLLAGAAPLALWPRDPDSQSIGFSWLAAGLAPLLGLVGLAGAFPAIAGQAARARTRAATAALGYWWLILAGPLLARHVWLAQPRGTPARAVWEGSLSGSAVHVLGPMLSLGVLLGAALWAAGSVVLPWIVRGRSAAVDVVCVTVWAAAIAATTPLLTSGLSAHAAHSAPRGAVLGAVLGATLAVGVRALRGPV